MRMDNSDSFKTLCIRYW